MSDFKAGEYVATERGFIFDKLRNQGDKVVVTPEYLKKNPEFSATWLRLVKADVPEEVISESKPPVKAK